MPVDSIWNTPDVLPCVSISMTLGSLSVTRDMEKSGSVFRISRIASSMTVMFRKPKVHFEKTQFLQRRHGVFRDDGTVVCP